jgi:hypothetical protein
MARNIVQREGENNATRILKIMGIEIEDNGELRVTKEPIM